MLGNGGMELELRLQLRYTASDTGKTTNVGNARIQLPFVTAADPSNSIASQHNVVLPATLSAAAAEAAEADVQGTFVVRAFLSPTGKYRDREAEASVHVEPV